ncbi:MAG: hypothetical protein R2711_12545 [Acidimicrobiales bacterium]
MASLAADDLSIRVLDGRADAAAELAAADLAVAAAGSTCWELGLLAVPSVVVSVAPNQEPLARRLGERGAARDLGDLTPDPRGGRPGGPSPRRLAFRSRCAVPGHRRAGRRSGGRPRRHPTPLGPARDASVQANDVRTVHELNDDPAVRAVSWSFRADPWADHERWFAARLADPRSHLYLGRARRVLVGLVRFQVEGAGGHDRRGRPRLAAGPGLRRGAHRRRRPAARRPTSVPAAASSRWCGSAPW